MQIALLIFDKLAAQDAVGPYEVMRNVPELGGALRRQEEG